MREAIEELWRAMSARRSPQRTPRLPRSLRPHAARTTFRPVTDIAVSRRVAA